jgi:hypothetical protein
LARCGIARKDDVIDEAARYLDYQAPFIVVFAQFPAERGDQRREHLF